MNDIDVTGTGTGFLRLNNLDSGKSDEDNVPGDEGIPLFADFRFSNVRVTGVPHLVQATEIHPSKPLMGLTLENITGTCAAGITLANIKNARLVGIKVTGFTGPLLATLNVTGSGLAGAATAEQSKVPDPVPPPAVPYRLH